MLRRVSRARRNRLWLLALAALALFASQAVREALAPAPGATAPPAAAGGETALRDAFAARRSGEMLEVSGHVEQMLRDDHDGSRHQRFLLALPSGPTVLVAHNIDLAPRVEGLAEGDPVEVRGQYEWNEKGGVLHWTHHDPEGRRPGGWVRHAGRLYR